MTGYWPSSFCSVFMGRDGVKVHKVHAKKKKKQTRPASSHLDRTSLVNKGFIIQLSGNFYLAGSGG